MRSPAAGAAIAILDFDRVDDMDTYLASELNIDNVAEALASEAGIDLQSGDVPLGCLYGGFGELVDFLDTFRDLRNYLPEDRSAHAVLRKVAQLLRWRFHFIEQGSELYDRLVGRYLDVLGVHEQETRMQFRSYLQSLAENWRGLRGTRRKKLSPPLDTSTAA